MDIKDIVVAISNSRVRITDHADEEAVDDRLTFDEIYFSVMHGEIIEDYPNDKPYPSCLIMGKNFAGEPIHSVWAYNADNEWAVMITVYRPDPARWIDWRVEGKEMMPFEKCPVCGGELEVKQVEKLLRGGCNTVTLKVTAEVCQHCGERLYAEDVVRSFEEIRAKLQKHEFEHLRPVGRSFTVDNDWPNKAIHPLCVNLLPDSSCLG